MSVQPRPRWLSDDANVVTVSSLNDRWVRAIGVPAVGFLLPNLAGMTADLSMASFVYWVGITYASSITLLIWTSLVHWGMKKHLSELWLKQPYRMFAGYATGSVLGGCGVSFLGALGWYTARGMDMDWRAVERLILMTAIAVCLLSQLYFSLYTRADLSFANVRATRLRAEEARALQLSIVYRQEPESILGAMRALRQLIYKDVRAAVCFAEELASVHRYILGESRRKFVMLREELEPLAAHQRLLQARFRTEFSLNIAIPADASERYLIVPASLHLLLENALLFGHFSATSPLPCVVDIGVDQCQIQLTYGWQARPTTRAEALRLDGLAARIRTLIGLEMEVDRSSERVLVNVPLLPLLA